MQIPADRKPKLEKAAALSDKLRSLRKNEAFAFIEETLKKESDRAYRELLTCDPADMEIQRQRVVAFGHVTRFIDKCISLGDKAKLTLEKEDDEEDVNVSRM